MKKFTEIYNEVIKDRLLLEKLKREYRFSLVKRFLWFLFIIFSLVICICFFGHITPRELLSDRAYTMILFVVVALVFGCFAFSFVHLREAFRRKFKESVIKKIITSVDDRLVYSPTYGITLMDYHKGFRDRSTKISSEDLITGTIDNNVSIRMSQIRATHEEEDFSREDGVRTTRTVVDYFGLYGFAVIPTSLALCEIKIVSNSFFRKFSKNRVEVESESFEKVYDIITKDRMYAMKIMKPKVIEAFNKVTQSGCKGLEVRIVGNIIYFRYQSGDIFEPAKVGDMFKPEKIREYLMTIYNPLNIIKALIYALDDSKNS